MTSVSGVMLHNSNLALWLAKPYYVSVDRTTMVKSSSCTYNSQKVLSDWEEE